MKTLLVFSRLIDAVTEKIGKAVGWLILVAVLVSAANAIVRKVFNVSSNAWLEAQWYLFGGAFMLAAAYTLVRTSISASTWSTASFPAGCSTGSTSSAIACS